MMPRGPRATDSLEIVEILMAIEEALEGEVFSDRAELIARVRALLAQEGYGNYDIEGWLDHGWLDGRQEDPGLLGVTVRKPLPRCPLGRMRIAVQPPLELPTEDYPLDPPCYNGLR